MDFCKRVEYWYSRRIGSLSKPERSLSGVNFADRPSALTQKKKANERILPFVTTYHPAVNNLKQILMADGTMESNTKSAFAENHLFETSDNIVQKK